MPKRSAKSSSPPKTDKVWFHAEFERAGISQRGAAAELDVDPSSLAHALAGKRKLQIQEAIDLARLLRLPLREILKRAGYDLHGIGL